MKTNIKSICWRYIRERKASKKLWQTERRTPRWSKSKNWRNWGRSWRGLNYPWSGMSIKIPMNMMRAVFSTKEIQRAICPSINHIAWSLGTSILFKYWVRTNNNTINFWMVMQVKLTTEISFLSWWISRRQYISKFSRKQRMRLKFSASQMCKFWKYISSTCIKSRPCARSRATCSMGTSMGTTTSAYSISTSKTSAWRYRKLPLLVNGGWVA